MFTTVQGLVTAVLGPDGFGAGWVKGEGFLPDIHFNVSAETLYGVTRVTITARLSLVGAWVWSVECGYTRDEVKLAIARIGLTAVHNG